MLLRREPDGTLAIGQPAHAWVAGQLARAWAEPFEPWEEVCLAAEQHDVGWAGWENAPELDPGTGLPYAFSALSPVRRLELWSGAAGLVLPQARYAALLVSLHGTLLVERFPPPGGAEVDEAAAAFLERERAFQERVLASLRADPAYAAYATPEAVAANRELVFLWDGLSLALLHGVTDQREVAGLALAPRDGAVAVSPWPFRDGSLTLVCEGRLLAGPFAGKDEMRRALAEAPWRTLAVRLVPGADS
ncbi:MAG TPA: DUF3891 family protein [Gaiellaceae bacterium]|nr:DUF3891 family protein [Gaiellaceae bacterium]